MAAQNTAPKANSKRCSTMKIWSICCHRPCNCHHGKACWTTSMDT